MTSSPSLRPVPQRGVLEIEPYVPGRSGAKGSSAIKLSANESPLGASPKAIAAFAEIAQQLEFYPEGSSRDLREALGEVHGLNPQRIVCGNGSDDLLHLLAQIYLGEGDEAVMSQYGFNVYPIIVKGAGASLVVAPEADYRSDVDALLAAVSERTKVLFLANPNNPTGTYIDAGELRRLHRGLRPDILLVVDSAYAEYVTATDYETGVELVNASSNVVMVRTFSKMGLAAARVGWMYAPEHVVDAVNRLRGPFNVNLAGQKAAAAATRDVDFTQTLKQHNAQWRGWLAEQIGSNRLRVLPSEANFVLVLFPSAEESQEAFDALNEAGLIVRQLHVYGIDNGLRISIGSEQAMRGVAAVLKTFGDRS
ncbi:histidinol-phosphate aminotransferase [Devosia pacifica]|uniref:Histidinol-phosphate aminotransferase n=1 Tax=Devosia pacifica TaxID=1335967 RepID=A0A918S6H3_9HYPH|nr:histidinol-phosphate transaminase [Devosia pacifica]GHA25996.1 histidinol-phosphate aminotransferase [Devosia pacifica]